MTTAEMVIALTVEAVIGHPTEGDAHRALTGDKEEVLTMVLALAPLPTEETEAALFMGMSQTVVEREAALYMGMFQTVVLVESRGTAQFTVVTGVLVPVVTVELLLCTVVVDVVRAGVIVLAEEYEMGTAMAVSEA